MRHSLKGWRRGTSSVLGAVAVMMTLAGAAPKMVQANTPANWEKSVTLQSQNSGDFGSATSDAAIRQAQQANANNVTLIINYAQDNVGSTAIYRSANSPSDAALIHAITTAHGLGMGVTFKLHLDPNDGQWRANINPSDRDTWYANYTGVLNYYATLAQQNHVEGFIVGAELISMATSTSNADNTQRWQTMIAQVRQRYSGTLSYSANWGGDYFAEEFTHIGFWNSLDQIGISAYFTLANANDPSVSQLLANWDYWRINSIQPFQQSIGKPVFFTEVGYRSVQGAATHPFDWWDNGPYDAQEQVNAIDALSQYWANYSWFTGLQYWVWSTNANCCGAGDTDYTVQNKPGYTALQNDFAAAGGSNPQTVSFTIPSATVTPTSGTAGTNFGLSATVTATGAAAAALVDMEVYNGNGTKVYQQFVSNQSFAAGQSRTFTFNWAAPSTQAIGQYTLSIGVFSNDWATSYIWAGNATTFTVTTGNTPAPTPVPASPTPVKTTATPTLPPPTATPPPTSATIQIWWPSQGATVSGVQPFKAVLTNSSLSQYSMYWQVDGGQLNLMADNTTDAPHKEADVSVAGWKWRGSGPYTLTFVAKDGSGAVLQQQSIQLYVTN